MNISTQARGLLITTAGVLAISPDTLLVRLLDLEKWSLICYRGIIIFSCLLLLTLLMHGRSTPQQFRRIGTPGICISLLFTCSTISFVTSLYYTSVANTLVIVAGSSMFAALYSRIFLREAVPVRTIVTMIVVIAAIGYIVSDSLGRGGLKGDLLAVLSAMFMAGAFTITRKARASNMIPATAISGLLSGLIGFCLAEFAQLDIRSIILLMCLGIALATAFALLTLGPRYISAPEVSLLLQIETVLGPFFIWMVLDERPTTNALIGGAIVIVALTIHSLLGLRAQARRMDVISG